MGITGTAAAYSRRARPGTASIWPGGGVLSRLVYFAAGVRFVDDLDNVQRITPVARVFDVILYGQLSSL